MFRAQHYHHLAEKRRQPGAIAARQAVKPGHEFAWEFGGLPEASGVAPASAATETEHAMLASLDKVLALAG